MKLRSVRAVTWTVPDHAASEQAFNRYLGYRTVLRGEVDTRLAESWGVPEVAGSPFAVLEPASGRAVYVRLIESPPTDGYAPLMTYGWNAAEFHVQDVHGLHESLSDSPFEIIGPPRDLLDNGAVLAMQVMGPGQELLYLTELRHAGLQSTFGRAEAPVDRLFIAVLGVADQARTVAFYEPMAQRINRRRRFRITRLAIAHGLDPETARFDIASAVMRDAFRIETDAYPDSAVKRPRRAGRLPAGLAMVSVVVDGAQAPMQSTRRNEVPYHGAGMQLIQGPDGEWLEVLVENG